MMERMLPNIEAVTDAWVILRRSPMMSRLQLELRSSMRIEPMQIDARSHASNRPDCRGSEMNRIVIDKHVRRW